ncbi:MAG: HAMP domain-containing histidine kinase [Oscillospiraceae bacterium]|nr:HAMP domain-containing histidine kinase [Oscillospiraceae bacterium]
MDNIKLKWKIFGFLTAFCALLLLILWFFQTVLLTDMYKVIRKAEIQKAIAYVQENIDTIDLQMLMSDIKLTKDIHVAPAQEFVQPERPMLNNGRDRREFEAITQTETFTLANGRTVSLTFYAMITPVDATVSTLKVQLYFITGIMILLSIALAFLIARKISKPIEKLSDGAKVLSTGDYDVHFSGRGFLEICELSDTLNNAAHDLSQVEALRRELMANISHDLRTPLALIYSHAEMMHDFPAEVTPEQTQVIMDETTRLSSLVNDVMDVSKLETGTMELYRRTYNLTESLGATIERLAALVKKDGYEITFVQNEEVYVNADEVKITQAFYNLLINAITHGGQEKNVTVRQSRAQGRVTIEVIDSGRGIPPEQLPLIWDRYYKVDKTHRRAVTGTGLGLSIVKKILQLHGGDCGVQSQVDKGSVFWFSLPTA